jgi:protein-S-isoprenylcysteine O-methyltransferase Ste14
LESWGKIAQKIRVPAGTVLGIVFLFLMHPSRRSLWIGGVVAVLGSLIRVWAAGHIDKGQVLARGGPYAHTRNPLYFGSFLMALGVLVAGQGYWLLVPFFAFFVGTYYPVMKAEEAELLQGHGQAFLEYARRVPMFFPTFGRAVSESLDGAGPPRALKPEPSIFLWSRVLRNREHRTLAGLVAVFLLLRFRA